MAAKDVSSSSLHSSAGRAPAYRTPLLNRTPLLSQIPPLKISLSQLELVDYPLPQSPKSLKPSGAFPPRTPLLSINLPQVQLVDHPLPRSSKPPKLSGAPPFSPEIVNFLGYPSSQTPRKPPSARSLQKELPSKHATSNQQPGLSLSETLPSSPPVPSSSKTVDGRSNRSAPERQKFISPPSLFDWSPSSEIVQGDGCTGSTSTRCPAFFDMHLHEDLLLKRVVFMPDLVTRISEVADLSFKVHGSYLLDENGPLPKGYPTKRSMRDYKIRKEKLRSERGVRTFYQSITESFLKIASTLVFGVPPPEESIFTWSSKTLDRRAIADGFLSVNETKTKAPLFENLRQELKLLADWHLNKLVVWELKSLSVGKKAVMDAILWYCSEEDFPWQTCTPGACNAPTLHPPSSVEPIKTGRKTSPDAQSRQWTLGLQPDDRKDIIQQPRATNQQRARYIIQQAWAEAVQSDVTFFIINAGQHELIGLRHRKTQTLYLSDVITICESAPAYGKLHIGLYIAAFQDALDRAHQLRDIKNDPKAQFPIRYRPTYAHDNRYYKHYVERPLRSEKETEEPTDENVYDFIRNVGDILRSTPRIRVQQDRRTNEIQCFLRLDINGCALDPAGRTESKESKNLTVELQPLNGSVNALAILLNDRPGYQICDKFVLKLYGEPELQKALDEYKMYLLLEKLDFRGRVDMLGLFGCMVDGSRTWALLMSHGGKSVVQEVKCPTKREILGPKYQRIVEELVRTNISHKGLRLDHFIFDSKKLSLISWSFASLTDDTDEGQDKHYYEGLSLSGYKKGKDDSSYKQRKNDELRRMEGKWERENRSVVEAVGKRFM